MIKSKEINNIDNTDKLILKDIFNNKDNQDILMKIFSEDELDYFNNSKEINSTLKKEILNYFNKTNSKSEDNFTNCSSDIVPANLNVDESLLAIKTIMKYFKYSIKIKLKKEIYPNISDIALDTTNEDNNNDFLELEKEINKKRNEGKLDNEIGENFEQIKIFINKIEQKLKEIQYEIEIVLIFEENKKNDNEKYKNYSCQYIIKIFGLDKSENTKFKDENILNNENYNSFKNLLENKIKLIKSNLSSIKKISSNGSSGLSITNNSLVIVSPYEIIKFIKTIGQHNEPANYIKELNNGIFVSGGENNLFFYHHSNYNKINYYKTKNINVYEKNTNNKNDTQLLVCTNEKAILLVFNKNFNYKFKLVNMSMRVYLKNNNNDIICN